MFWDLQEAHPVTASSLLDSEHHVTLVPLGVEALATKQHLVVLTEQLQWLLVFPTGGIFWDLLL